MKTLLKTMLPDSVLSHAQALDHYWHGEHELRLISKLCDPTRVALDVGANIGTYTYFLRKHAQHVHAFEPNARLAHRLAVLFPDVTIHNEACSDHCGSGFLDIPTTGNREAHELGSLSESGAAVRIVTIDSLGLENVGFLKVDVERHERPVLRGALNTIERFRPVILTEFTPLLYSQPVPLEFKFITDLNYEGWFRFNGAYLPFSKWDDRLHGSRESWREKKLGGNIFLLPLGSNIMASSL